ncbi:MAG TPA: glycosyltransferase, partial [Fusibacter sp.]|nr:glycosyltransferase [Fusibacter sp.]
IHKAPTLAYPSRAFRKLWFQWLSLTVLPDVDVVVNFGRVDYLEFILKTSIPAICRFANPIHQHEIDFLLDRRKGKCLDFIGISKCQVKHLDYSELFTIIYNGVDLSHFDFVKEPVRSPSYLVFLGRLTRNKGVDTAISVAQGAGIPLKIAGNLPENEGDRHFFETAIKPKLGYGCEWIGPVDDRQKNELLGHALALLFPIRWNEPFGIVMIESLACGTPVIATHCASTPEIIDHGKTGFLCDSVNDMIKAAKNLHTINRLNCRIAVETSFSADTMIEKYLESISKYSN